MEENENLNIVLVGMPGAGKSYIGGKLAKLLVQLNYVDTDDEIEKSLGLTISEIFEMHGEKHFRKIETDTIKKISENKNQIISIGGGAFENSENIEHLKSSGITFYLKTSPKELFQRMENETHRPLFTKNFSLETLKNMQRKREKNYQKADFVIDTDYKQAYTILDDILRKYESYVKSN